MKKIIIVLFMIFLVFTLIIFINLKTKQNERMQVKKYNLDYEYYNKDDLYGIDITTVINKAIDSNEKNFIIKDEEGMYIPNEENSIKIYIKMIINNKVYPMEKIQEIGIQNFTEFFGEIKFRCIDIKYHKKTGKISEMIFESIEY